MRRIFDFFRKKKPQVLDYAIINHDVVVMDFPEQNLVPGEVAHPGTYWFIEKKKGRIEHGEQT
jgi:hypothetical protein